MAKFSSEFATQAPSHGYVQSGVVESATDYSSSFTGLRQAFRDWDAKNAASKSNEEQARRDQAVGIYAQQQLELEEAEANRNQEFANMRQEMTDLANSDRPEDAARMAQITRQYQQLQAAEAAGANPGTIKARQRALLKKQLAENPHLSTQILTTFGKVDSLQKADSEMSADPYKTAFEGMLQAQAGGVSVGQQIELNKTKQNVEMAELKVKAQAAAGKLAFTDELEFAVAQNGENMVDAGQFVAQLSQAKDEIGNPVLYNQDQIKSMFNAKIDTMINEYKAGLLQRYRESGQSISSDQLSELTKQFEGNLRSTYDGYFKALDEKDYMQRMNDLSKARLEALKYTNMEILAASQPEIQYISDNFGSQQAYLVQADLARIPLLLANNRGGRQAVEQMAQQADNPSLAMALAIYDKMGPFKTSKMRLDGQSTGNTIVDSSSDAGLIQASGKGHLNFKGDQQVLVNVMSGPSYNNVSNLMSDQYYNKVKTDPETQKAVRQVADTKMTELLAVPEQVQMLEAAGVKVNFNPVAPTRTKSGTRFMPAEAFSVAGDAPIEIQKIVHKLNGLYTLSGSFMTSEELQSTAQRWSSMVDIENPDFIRRSIEVNKASFEELKKQTEASYKHRLSPNATDPNIYSTDPNRNENYRAKQSMAFQNKMKQYDMLIEAENNRDPDSPFYGMPPGTTIDEEESALQGKTIYMLPNGQYTDGSTR